MVLILKVAFVIFLWEKDKEDLCLIYRHDCNGISCSKRYLVEDDDDIFIRYPNLVSIKNKAFTKDTVSFETIVSSRKPYGLASDFFVNPAKFGLPPISDEPIPNGDSILGLLSLKRIIKYIPKNYPLPKKRRDK